MVVTLSERTVGSHPIEEYRVVTLIDIFMYLGMYTGQ
jgi:hypothetical protein